VRFIDLLYWLEEWRNSRRHTLALPISLVLKSSSFYISFPNTNAVLSLRSSGFDVSSVPLKGRHDKLYIHVKDIYERENATIRVGTNNKKNAKMSGYLDIEIDVSLIRGASRELTLAEFYRGSHPRSDSSFSPFREMLTYVQFVDFYHEVIYHEVKRIDREEADTAQERRAVPMLVETNGEIIDEALKITPLL